MLNKQSLDFLQAEGLFCIIAFLHMLTFVVVPTKDYY